MYNKTILVGRLTADPELRFTGNGIAVCNFTLACNRPFQSKDGSKETDFIDVVVWRGLAETCGNHLKKGYMVAVDGRLEIRSYEDKQGIRRKVAEVVADTVRFLDRGKNGAAASNNANANNTNASAHYNGGQQDVGGEDEFTDIPFTDDDLPF